MADESKFSATKGARPVAVLFALLLALMLILAFSAKPASAGPDLVGQSGGGADWGIGYSFCPPDWPKSSTALNWIGTDFHLAFQL